MAYRLTQAAEAQLDRILLTSAHVYGTDAAIRYNLLMLATMAAVGANPLRLGSTDIPRLPGIRAYPAQLSRAGVESPHRVQSPRHLVIYRVAADGVTEVLGLAHDRMVLSRAARKAVKNAGKP